MEKKKKERKEGEDLTWTRGSRGATTNPICPSERNEKERLLVALIQ